MRVGGHLKSVKPISVGADPEQSDDSAFLPVQAPPAEQAPALPVAEDVPLPVDNPSLLDLHQSLSQSSPDENAKVIGLAQKTGAPEPFIASNLPAFERAAAAPPTSFFAELDAQYPGTTKFLADPRNMAVAHDDLQNVADHEKAIKDYSDAHSWAHAWTSGWQQSALGLRTRQALPDTHLESDPSFVERQIATVAGLVGDSPLMVAGSMAGSAAGPLGATAGAFALPAMVKTYLTEKYKDGGIQDFSDALHTVYRVGIEGGKQALVGLITGGAGGVASKTIGGTLAPLAAEWMAMTTAGKAVEGEVPNAQDFIDNLTLIAGMHGLSHITGQAILGQTELKKAEEAKNFYTALGETAEGSKLRSRLPEAHQELVKQLTADGPVESIHIPVEAFTEYFQSKDQSPEEFAQELGVEKSLEEAKQTGSAVEIPLSTWTDRVVGAEHYSALANDVKFDPEGHTVNEAQALREEVQQQLKELEAKHQAESDKIDASAAKIYDKVSSALKDAGLSKTEIRLAPVVHEAFFRTLGKTLGVDPHELAKRFPLDINGGLDFEHPNESANLSSDLIAAQNQEGKTLHQSPARQLQSEHPLPESVSVTHLDPTKFGAEPFGADATKNDKKAYRDAAVKFARENFQGKSFENSHTGWEISVPRTALDRSKSHSVTPEMTAAFGHLDQIIKDAVFLHSDADLRGRKEVNGFNYLYAPVEADGKSFVAKITIKDDGGKKFHVHAIEEVERPAGLMDTGVISSRAPVYESPNLSISQLLTDINDVRQRDPHFQAGSSGPRGRIRLSDKGATIDLFKDADKSTFLHETGHYFLDVFGKLSEQPEIPKQVKDDFNTLLKWFGVDSADQITTEHHEKFARGFEAYLMEGKAPSKGLASAFRRFKTWLVEIYRSMKNLNVELTPEVRGVMDRMLATDEEIQAATQNAGLTPIDPAGLPAEIVKKLNDLQGRARDIAESTLLREQMEEMKSNNSDFLKSERDRLVDEATAQVKLEPLFRAIESLREVTGKKGELVAAKFLENALPTDEAAHIEVVAETEGFPSGEALAREIVKADETKVFDHAVKARVDAEMAKYADMRKTPKIREEALKAVHNEKMTELLALEREALMNLVHEASVKGEVAKRKRLDAKVEAQAAKEQAREILAGKSIKDSARSRVYVTAERNAAVRAAKAIARKDYAAAAKAKREQMLNHALASEAIRNATEVEKSMDYLGQFAERGRDLKDMPYGFTRQIDSLLARFGIADPRSEDLKTLTAIAGDMLTKGESPFSIANATGLKVDEGGKFAPESLPDLVTRVNEDYHAMSVPDSVLSDLKKDPGELTLSELRDLRNAVKTIAFLGKTFERFLESHTQVDMRTAAKQLLASIEENYGAPFAKDMLPGSRHATKLDEFLASISNLPGSFDRILDTVATTCRKLDGLKLDGPAQDFISRPLTEASNRRQARTRVAMEEMDAIFAKHYELDEFAKYKDTRVDIDGRFFTKEEILSMALNWGNEGNRDRLMRGFDFDETKMERIFSHLDKKDWDFAQATWDHIHGYWKDIVALEMDTSGVEPKGVEPAPFENQHGKYGGGYYPIAYDFEKSSDAYKNAEARSALFKQFSTAKAATEQGHTEARVSNVTRPVRLSLDVLRTHHEDVIHDLEFRRAVIDASRFLNQKDTRTAITNALGVRGYRAIGDWLKSAAGQPSEPLSFGEQAARWFRFKTTMYLMAYNMKSAFKIAPENVVNLSSELGVSGAARAMKDYWLSDSGHEDVVSRSEFMRGRAEHLNRDLADIQNKWRGTGNSAFHKYAFFVHAYLDQAVSFPLWMDVYKREMADHGTEKKAVLHADEAVERTFMSGRDVSQAAIMRGSEKTKFLTVAYGYHSMMWNRFSEQKFGVTKAIERGEYLDAAALAARSTLYTFLMPAAVVTLSRELLRNSRHSSDEERKKRIAENVLEEATPLKFIPVLRDVAPQVIRKGLGEHTGNFQASPLESALDTLIGPIGASSSRLPEATANSISLLTGIPKSFNDEVFNFIDWQKNNGEATWKDFLSRRTKK